MDETDGNKEISEKDVEDNHPGEVMENDVEASSEDSAQEGPYSETEVATEQVKRNKPNGSDRQLVAKTDGNKKRKKGLNTSEESVVV